MYQQLHEYKGSMYGAPHYSGMEFDYEVADNTVVASPGGVSTTQHHWTKGVYGDGASQWDIYAGEGFRYPYGELGNTYEVGQSSITDLDAYPYPPDVMPTQNQRTYHKDNFTKIPKKSKSSDIEFIGSPDTDEVTKISESSLEENRKIALPFSNIWLTLLILFLVYASFHLLARGGEDLLFAQFNGGKVPNWKWLGFYGLIVLAIAVMILSSVDLVPK